MFTTYTTILGILAIVAGIAILIWPTLLSIIVALSLIVLGAYAVIMGLAGQPTTR